jgi:hypothetical protein
MRVALVGPELEENLALRYLHASVAAAGHEGRIFDFHAPEQIPGIIEALLEYDPGMVGLSMVFTIRAREFIDLAEALRRKGYAGHITAGGHFATFHSDRLLGEFPAFDSIVHGEGEEAIVDLIRNVNELDEVAGISFRDGTGRVVTNVVRCNPDNLDLRPFPTRPDRFHDYMGFPIANVLSSRGCFGRCNFCSIHAWYQRNPGKRFRQRSVEEVAREMAGLYHQRGVRIFNFHDDNFFLPVEERNVERFKALKRLLDKAAVGPIAVQVKSRPDSITPGILGALKDLGLFRVFLGVESNSVAGLKTLGRGIRRNQNHSALHMLMEEGVHTTFNLLMFDPESTMPDIRDNIAFISQFPRVPLNFGRTEVYAGTPLEARLRSQNRLIAKDFITTYRIADPRAQMAFEIFKEVFIPRNFHDDGMNLEAMKLDYYFHLLRHFRPERADASLEKQVKGWLLSLNTNNAELLERICDFVEAGMPMDSQVAGFAQLLAEERAEFDRGIAREASKILEDIKRLAEEQVSPNHPSIRMAASAAAVALIITVAGCGKHMHEMAPSPERIEKPVESPQLPAESKEIVRKTVDEKHQMEITSLLVKHDVLKQEIQLRLSVDAKGNVTSAEVILPAEVKKPTFKKELAELAEKWTFKEIRSRGDCTVKLKTGQILRRDDWHMTEMMIQPMDE